MHLCLEGVGQDAKRMSESWVGGHSESLAYTWHCQQGSMLSCPILLGEGLTCQNQSGFGALE
jgi:hypothetical protein